MEQEEEEEGEGTKHTFVLENTRITQQTLLIASHLTNVGAGLQYQRQRRREDTTVVAFEAPTNRMVKPPAGLRQEQRPTKKRKNDPIEGNLKGFHKTIEIALGKKRKTQRARREEEFDNDEEENQLVVDNSNPNEVAKIGLWNADTHMFLWGRLNRCIDIFESTSVTLVHPAVVDPTNLRNYFASWVEGSGATASFLSPLSFNITVALAQGARAAGDKELEAEYWMKARNQAGALFDVADFHVAMGLLRLCEYARHRGLEEQATYYAQLALATCEKLNLCNSVVYSWSIVFLFLGGAALPVFQQKTHKARALPYLTQIETDLKLHDTLPATSSCVTPRGAGYTLESVDDERIDKYGVGMQLDSVFQEVLLGITFLHSHAITHLEDPTVLVDLEDQLYELKGRWELVKHVFSKPQQIKMDTIFTLNQTLLGWVLKKEARALTAAIELLKLAEEPMFPYLPLLQRPQYFPLKVLLETGNMFLLYRLLSVLRPLNGGTFLDTPLLEEFKRFL